MHNDIVQIEDQDEVSRCIIYDRAFDHDVHNDNVLWRFDSGRKEDGAYHESAVLRRFAPDESQVHQIGCRIAAAQNLRKNPPPGPERRYYCGFRTATYEQLPKSGEGFTVAITHHPENGEQAHVDIALFIDGPKLSHANKRTNAGLALAEAFGIPRSHRCPCDEGDCHHPFDKFGENCLSREFVNPGSNGGFLNNG